jgi:hypothetical protein
LPPASTVTFSAAIGAPRRFVKSAAIASRSSGSPVDGP